MEEQSSRAPLIISYLTLRKAIGVLGISLPFMLLLGTLVIFRTGVIEHSISHYYYTSMGDFFVGIIFVIGVFLFSYKGYGRIDDLVGNLACFFAIGLALFPTAPLLKPSVSQQIIGVVHWAFASLFFITLAYFSLFLFTKTHPEMPMSKRKIQRNHVYKTCGIVMLLCILFIFLIQVLLPQDIRTGLQLYKPVFWFESLAILAFGLSWLTKGQALLKD